MRPKALSFLLVCLLGLTSGQAEQDLSKIEWWKKTNYYHIYIRSFKDTDGNGEGDIRGIIDKLDYLKTIGVETLLLSPFYSSPMKDIGYDIEDYVGINERFGTMQDVDSLIAGLKARSMRLVLDFVPNHSSNKHKWFQCSERALIDPENCGKYKDYYVWSNSTRFNNSRPTNWISLFGGDTAWRWSPTRKEFYLHQFLPEQPDLNLRDPAVREEFKEIARFWLRKGADGLRIDAVLHFLEDIKMRDEPQDPMWLPHWNPYDRLLHIHTRSMSESATVVKDWHQVAQEPEFGGNRVIITEAYDSIPKLIEYYGTSPQNRYADMPFNFQLFFLTELNLKPSFVEQTILSWLNATAALEWPREHDAISPWTCWVTGNHDNTRITNRVGEKSSDIYKFIAHLVPGVPVNYYGDEIGMQDADFSAIPKRTIEEGEPTRLIFRAPMAWTSEGPAGGFSSNSDTWMPLNPNYKSNNVESLMNGEGKNHLKNFIQLLAIRRQYLETLVFGDLAFYRNQPSSLSNVLAFARTHHKFKSLLLLANLDTDKSERITSLVMKSGEPAPIPQKGKIVMLNFVVAGGDKKLAEGQTVELTDLELAPSQVVLLEF